MVALKVRLLAVPRWRGFRAINRVPGIQWAPIFEMGGTRVSFLWPVQFMTARKIKTRRTPIEI
jgi:hypothetical protein